MKKKNYLIGLIIIMLIAGLLILTGCKKEDNNSNNTSQNSSTNTTDNSNNNNNNVDNEIAKTISCSKDFFLFKSQKYVEHIFYLNKDNKLIKYDYIEKYHTFTDDNEFKTISEGVDAEAELNNRTYPYLHETPVVSNDPKEVTITDTYDISKMESKNKIPTTEIKENLSEDFVLDVENLKNVMINKEYTVEELFNNK